MTVTFDLALTQSSQPVGAFGSGDDILTVGDTNIPHAPAPLVAVLELPWIVAGPAHLEFDPGLLTTNYTLSLAASDSFGAQNEIVSRTGAIDGAGRVSLDVVLPAAPIALFVGNASTTTDFRMGSASLVVDLSRVG